MPTKNSALLIIFFRTTSTLRNYMSSLRSTARTLDEHFHNHMLLSHSKQLLDDAIKTYRKWSTQIKSRLENIFF